MNHNVFYFSNTYFPFAKIFKIIELPLYGELDPFSHGSRTMRLLNPFWRNNVHEDDEPALLLKAKNLKLDFLTNLAEAYQHYLPLQNNFLRYLSFLCPIKAMENNNVENKFINIAECLPGFEEDDYDDLRSEVRALQRGENSSFAEALEAYKDQDCSTCTSGEIDPMINSRVQTITIDQVWKPVISNIQS